MNKLRILLYTCFSLILFAACEDEIEYERIDKKPIGGFLETAITVNADYFSQEVETVVAKMDLNRMTPDKTVNLAFELSADVDSLAPAFTLANETVAIHGMQDTVMDILTIDWSKLPINQTVKVTVNVKEEGEVDVNSGRSQIVFTVAKGKAPVVSMNQGTTWKALLPYDASANKKFKLAVLTLDKPAVQDLVIPFTLNQENVQKGTHFNITSNGGEQVIVVPAGETTGEVEIEVIESAFTIGQSAALWIEARKNPDAQYMYTVNKENWWSTISMGRDALFNLFVDSEAEYDALLADSTEIVKLISVTLPNVVDRVLTEELLIPISLNEEVAQENVHFVMPEKVIRVKKGQRNGVIMLKVLGDAFKSADDNVQLWIELGNLPDVGYDNNNWWTTINIGVN